MINYKNSKIMIQLVVLVTFIFGIIVATLAYDTGSFTLGLIFMSTIQIIILLSILYILEHISEIIEASK